ncbi:Elongator complex protein 1 [Oryzias melastigma]|uniref:Elongator complex protein 1 n=1 Tax=Oryzias melastigma TaxID=30732 RepID=A0A834FBL3_ORYME|nr:Elongator complex protein 1 [Oryzias melastigma]
MSSFQLQSVSNINQVTFLCRPGGSNQLAALTSDGQVCLYTPGEAAGSTDGFRTASRPLVLHRTFRVAVSQPAPLALRQLLWLQDELFVSVTCGLLPGSSSLLMLRPDGDALVVRARVEVDGVVVGVTHRSQTGTWLCSWRTDGSGGSSGEHLLGLSDRSHLYAGDTEVGFLALSALDVAASRSEIWSASPQLASNVSSFAVCNDFLLLTTHSHSCRCLHLSALTLKGLQAALASDGDQNDETFRRVERGSRIVTVVPQDTRVILQVD